MSLSALCITLLIDWSIESFSSCKEAAPELQMSLLWLSVYLWFEFEVELHISNEFHLNSIKNQFPSIYFWASLKNLESAC